jgi:hypothetical protein
MNTAERRYETHGLKANALEMTIDDHAQHGCLNTPNVKDLPCSSAWQ